MKDFNNTFISTKHLTVKQLTSLYLKYKGVLEKSGHSVTGTKTTKFICSWDYLYVENQYMSYSDDLLYLMRGCRLKQITEQDLDNYLKEQDNMPEYNYVSVTDLAISDVVNAMVNGDEFYMNSPREGYLLIPMNTPLSLLNHYVNNGSLYRKVEAPWYEKHKGSLVAVKDYGHKTWKYDVFEEYNEVAAHPFQCIYDTWKEMRPLTQAEKDSIITKG